MAAVMIDNGTGQVWVYRQQPVLLPASSTFAIKLSFGLTPPYQRGDRVVIPKGTVVKSTYPGWPPDGKPAGKTYEVTVWACSATREAEEKPTGRLSWVGSAGYWKWCDTFEAKPAPSALEKLSKALT